LYLTGAGALLAAFVAPFVWRDIQAEHIWLFVAISIFGTAGMTMMTQAFRFAPAALVAPLDYTALVWATAFGWLIWSEVPDTATFIGAGIIIASGVIIIMREYSAKD
ncbi:MAG: EamA family transporter, partial [Devosia sp.]